MRRFLTIFFSLGAFMYSEILTPFQPQIESLTAFEKSVIVDKATERPFTGDLLQVKEDGTYSCKLCGSALYRSKDKFDSHCGWPSFDDEIAGAIKRIPDADGRRVEIVCATCGGHLGHLFEGEGMTPKNTRHCVNSVSLTFQKDKTAEQTPKAVNLSRAYLAGGCFWGVEHYLQELDGVESVVSGFMGGHVANPDYYDVVKGTTGHLETVEVLYDATKVSYHDIVQRFFEIHDPVQTDGQGPDIGSQYLSAIFIANESEASTVADLIKQLETNGYRVATQILPQKPFYPADDYHQDYYEKKGRQPYCHGFVDRFNKKR
jgi:peptide methionine sulfoxide reductase msrA/msrB